MTAFDIFAISVQTKTVIVQTKKIVPGIGHTMPVLKSVSQGLNIDGLGWCVSLLRFAGNVVNLDFYLTESSTDGPFKQQTVRLSTQ